MELTGIAIGKCPFTSITGLFTKADCRSGGKEEDAVYFLCAGCVLRDLVWPGEGVRYS